MTAVPPRCCPGCAGPCRRRTGRTSRLVACIERRHTRPSACCNAFHIFVVSGDIDFKFGR